MRIPSSPPLEFNPLETMGFLERALFLRIHFRDTFEAHHAISRDLFSPSIPLLPDDPSRYSLLPHSCTQPPAITDR